jgi:undecaprenyl-phosphate galactose phosphotransferase/putative colanic acid biosynthesis UDP-glucose lipid carrier transferase
LWTFLAFVLAFFSLLLSVFCLKTSANLSRLSTILLFGGGWFVVSAGRCCISAMLHHARIGAHGAEPAVVLADPSELSNSNALQRLHDCGYEVSRIVDVDTRNYAANSFGKDIDFIRDAEIRHIFLLLSWSDAGLVEKLLADLQVLSIPIYLLPDTRAAPFMRLGGAAALNGFAAQLRRAPLNEQEQDHKRMLDMVLASVALILLSPLMLAIALAIRLGDGGRILFRQRRNGLDGRPFSILKFRTMHVMDDGPQIRQAVENDSRVTAVGRILRKLNFDELPQLINVLLGDMSLVGPRPHAVAHNNEYGKLIENYASRHRIKPGITGWAQINGLRGETSTVDKMAERVDLDLWYVNNWSFTLDVKILFRTLILGLQTRAY